MDTIENSKLIEVLQRIGDGQLITILGAPAYGIIDALGKKGSGHENIVRLAIELHSSQGLLRDNQQRSIILGLLRSEEATDLCKLLDIECKGDPYTHLLGLIIRKKSKNETILFNYFNVLIIQEIEFEKEDKNSYDRIVPNYSLFEYQKEAIITIMSILETSDNRLLLHMPTGSGKTRVAMNAVSRHLNMHDKAVILWLAYSEELCDQAVEEFIDSWKNLGDRPVDIHRFYKDYKWDRCIEDGIIVAGLAKMWNKEKREDDTLENLSSRITMIVFDEAHQALAETYSQILQIILSRNEKTALMGLSATPGRTSDRPDIDLELASLFYRKKVSIDVEGYTSPIDYLIDNGYLSSPTFYSLSNDSISFTDNEIKQIEKNLDIPESILNRIAIDDIRNVRIINTVVDLVRKGHKRIILFAVNVNHSNLLSIVLRYLGYSAYSITNNTNDENRKQIIDLYKTNIDKPIILCNYGVLTTGFDAPKTSASIIARPTKSLILYSQMVGRSLRGPKVGGTKKADIWTVIDSELPEFNSLVKAFWKWEDVWA